MPAARACTLGNHSTCTAKSCGCSCHRVTSRDYSGACAEGDHGECQMPHTPGVKARMACACPTAGVHHDDPKAGA